MTVKRIALSYMEILHRSVFPVYIAQFCPRCEMWKSLSCVWLCDLRLYSPRGSPGQNTGVGCLPLLQGILLTQELNWGLQLCTILYQLTYQGSSDGSGVNNPSANEGDAGDVGLIPGLESPPGEENGNPLQYSCLGNPMDRGAWWATAHRVTKNRTQVHRHIYEMFSPFSPLANSSHSEYF